MNEGTVEPRVRTVLEKPPLHVQSGPVGHSASQAPGRTHACRMFEFRSTARFPVAH